MELTPPIPPVTPRRPDGAGAVALVGSGEYLPVMTSLEQALLDAGRAAGHPPRYVQLATAAAPEGVASLRRWHTLGRAAAERIGAEQVVVPVTDRDDALNEANAELVAGAALIYLSGGDPGYLTRTLAGTAVWTAIEAAWRAGASLAGCSAGAMAMGGRVADIRGRLGVTLPGLGVLAGVEVLPHFDMLDRRFPQLVADRLGAPGEPVQLVGIDEETALVSGLASLLDGGPDGLDVGLDGARAGVDGPSDLWPGWHAVGRRSVWLLNADGRVEAPGRAH